MTKLSEYMHTAEAAEYLSVHHNTVRKWASRGDRLLSEHQNCKARCSSRQGRRSDRAFAGISHGSDYCRTHRQDRCA
ncbi:MAG: hypothetical protein ACK5EO_09670 [Planctomycetota bacterium]